MSTVSSPTTHVVTALHWSAKQTQKFVYSPSRRMFDLMVPRGVQRLPKNLNPSLRVLAYIGAEVGCLTAIPLAIAEGIIKLTLASIAALLVILPIYLSNAGSLGNAREPVQKMIWNPLIANLEGLALNSISLLSLPIELMDELAKTTQPDKASSKPVIPLDDDNLSVISDGSDDSISDAKRARNGLRKG